MNFRLLGSTFFVILVSAIVFANSVSAQTNNLKKNDQGLFVWQEVFETDKSQNEAFERLRSYSIDNTESILDERQKRVQLPFRYRLKWGNQVVVRGTQTMEAREGRIRLTYSSLVYENYDYIINLEERITRGTRVREMINEALTKKSEEIVDFVRKSSGSTEDW